ncbi:MAG TPA: methyltransferase domain-containing protein [Mycobacteriales bacterium]|nr:methyltransferase domain-containing protein [Mycobacteriales bacterium]
MTDTAYVFDQAWHAERARLEALEQIWDPATTRLLTRVGVRAGWRCLEVGAGAGSTARWLARCVGSHGCVVATDLDTRHLLPLQAEGVQALRHDILRDGTFEGSFDLVHARLVVEHVGVEALPRLVECLRPGGILVVEDLDFCSAVAADADNLFERVLEALLEAMTSHGFDPWLGRRLGRELEEAGLTAVEVTAHTGVLRGGSLEAEFYRLSLISLGERAKLGALRRAEVEELLGRLRDPAWSALLPTLVQATGTRAH